MKAFQPALADHVQEILIADAVLGKQNKVMTDSGEF